jgi:uncharacterized membrane protein
MASAGRSRGIGNVLAPPRFIAFAVASAAAIALLVGPLGLRHGIMAGFDIGAVLFLILSAPLVRNSADDMRESASRNDANRVVLLMITGVVSLVILVAVASELMQRDVPRPWSLALIVGTLSISWIFSNWIYALHYAHLFYSADGDDDAGGLCFPETKEPDYWDFIYFAFCLGMTFQTSDVSITTGRMRRTVTLHCLAAFVFNLGIIAFSINVLGGG